MSRLSLALLAALASAPVLAQPAPKAAPSPSPDEQARADAAAAVNAAANATARARAAPEAAARAAAQADLDAAQRALRVASERLVELQSVATRAQIEAAIERPVFSRPALGIVMGRDETAGVKLLAVTPDSPAAKAGLRTGDRVLRIDGDAVPGEDAQSRLRAAQERLRKLEEGDSVALEWQRDGKRQTSTITAKTLPGLTVWNGAGLERLVNIEIPRNLAVDLGSLAPLAGCGVDGSDCQFAAFSEAWRWQGLQLATVGPELGRYFGTDRGVLVLAAPDESMAALKPGDVIQEVDKERVDTPQDAMRALRAQTPGTPVSLTLLRDRKRQQASVEAPRRMRFIFPTPPQPPEPPAPPAPAAPMTAPAPPAPPAPPPPPPGAERVSVVILAPPAPPAPMSPPAPPAPPLGILESVLR